MVVPLERLRDEKLSQVKSLQWKLKRLEDDIKCVKVQLAGATSDLERIERDMNVETFN